MDFITGFSLENAFAANLFRESKLKSVIMIIFEHDKHAIQNEYIPLYIQKNGQTTLLTD